MRSYLSYYTALQTHWFNGALTSDARFKGPGHHALLRDPATGTWHIAYHRWEGQQGDGPYAGQRRIVVQPITYTPDGTIEAIAMAENVDNALYVADEIADATRPPARSGARQSARPG